jgi:hypothetical protein
MTSLVALSLNTLAVGASSLSSTNRKRQASSSSGTSSGNASNNINNINSTASGASGVGGGGGNSASVTIVGPAYMLEGLQSGFVSFSLEAVVDITKINAHRVSSVWQMVTSHLRMIGSLKQPLSRQIAVASTHDIIYSAIDYLDSTKPQPIATTVFLPNDPVFYPNIASQGAAGPSPIHLSDQLIYNQILPAFENVFVPKLLHKECLAMREINAALNPELSQLDLLSSLKSLSFIRYEDVRNAVMHGLLQLLMTRGHLLTTGWPVIIELLASVPAASVSNSAIVSASCLVDEAALINQASGLEEDEGDGMESMSPNTQSQIKSQLSKALLAAAFNCAKYIADEFLHAMSIPDVKSMIGCFAIFAAQSTDLNTSLTSVELLWRVCDNVLFRFKSESGENTEEAAQVYIYYKYAYILLRLN